MQRTLETLKNDIDMLLGEMNVRIAHGVVFRGIMIIDEYIYMSTHVANKEIIDIVSYLKVSGDRGFVSKKVLEKTTVDDFKGYLGIVLEKKHHKHIDGLTELLLKAVGGNIYPFM